MEYLHATLLLHSAGKKITLDSIKKIVSAAGLKPDDSKIKALVASLEGVNIDEAVKAAPVAMASTAVPAAATAAAPAAASKPEKTEESDDMGLESLFG